MELADLHQLGPGADPVMLDATARAAFFTVKRAWATGRPEICRRQLTSAAWEAQQAGIEALLLDGRRQVYEDLMVTSLNITGVEVDGSRQRVTLRGLVAGKAYVVDSSAKVVLGSRGTSQWIEDWTLERSVDAGDVAARAAAACPGCGAPLSIDPDGLCTFCRTPLPGYTADWLVAAIDRPPIGGSEAASNPAASAVVLAAMAAGSGHEPRPSSVVSPDAAAAVTALQARDRAFNPTDFVVGARHAFLAVVEGRADLAPATSRAYLSDELWTVEQARIDHDRTAGQHAVRAYLDIDGFSIVSADTGADRDRLTVRVSARSADHRVELHTGVLLDGSSEVLPWTEDLIFERSAGAVTRPLRGLADGVCPNCSAELSVDAGGTCRSCGASLTDGSLDWVMTGMGETVPRPSGDVPTS